jgi:hypothetical protein
MAGFTRRVNASIDCASLVSADRLWGKDGISRHMNEHAARQKVLIPAGRGCVIVRIVVDRVNDISAKENPITIRIEPPYEIK